MARADTIAKLKTILYGTGLYEKPAIRQMGASGNDSLGSADTVVLTTGDASKISKGDILSSITGAAASSYVFYVLSTTSTTVTATATWQGSVSPSSADLNSALLEQNAYFTEQEMHGAIDTVLNSYLYPELFSIASTTVTPNLSTGQVEVAASVKEILGMWQLNAGKAYQVPFNLMKNLPTGVSSTTTLLEGKWRDGSTAYVTFVRKLVEADTYDWLEDLLAYGAAALLVDTSAPKVLVPYRPDTGGVQAQMPVGEAIWRSFLTIREQARLDISRDYPEFQVIH